MFKKWETVFFSTKSNEYYSAKSKLENAGIKNKSKVDSGSNTWGRNMSGRSFTQMATYEILVLEEDIGRANAVIRSK